MKKKKKLGVQNSSQNILLNFHEYFAAEYKTHIHTSTVK